MKVLFLVLTLIIFFSIDEVIAEELSEEVWERLESMPTARTEVAAVAIKEKISLLDLTFHKNKISYSKRNRTLSTRYS